MKKVLIPIILLATILLVVGLTRFNKIGTFSEDGYVLLSNSIENNLLSGNHTEIEYQQVYQNNGIYEKRDNIYAGETEKKELYHDTPLITNDGSRVINLYSSGYVIDSDFQKSSLYKNLIMTNGSLYNDSNNERVDNYTYLFMELENKVYVNSLMMNIKTYTDEYNIPMNSFVYFLPSEIRFYYLKDGEFIFKKILGLDNNSNIHIDNNNYYYKDFLLKMGLSTNISKEESQVELVPEEKEEIVEETVEYIAPNVNVSNIKTNTYSMIMDLTVNDSQGHIKKSPTFEFITNDKTYMRKTLASSGTHEITGLLPNTEFTIIGSYTYYNEKHQLIKKEFFNSKVTTTDITNLEHISISLENNNIYQKKIELKNIQILNDKSVEVIKGIKSIGIRINKKEIFLPASYVTKLKSGGIANFLTGDILKTNTEYKYEIIVYDVAGNEITVDNNAFTYKTSKNMPTAEILVENKDYTMIDLSVKINNDDDALLNNMKYLLSTASGDIITQGEYAGGNIQLHDLNGTNVYKLILFGDYDLNDNQGVKKEQKLCEINFTTLNILSLGSLSFNFKDAVITSSAAHFNFELNVPANNELLNQLFDSVNINIIDSNTNDIVETKTVTISDLNYNITSSVPIEFNNLNSDKTYLISLTSKIKQGSVEFDVEKTKSNIDEFTTLKNDAKVFISNVFTTDNLIEFDYNINDIDKTIENNNVLFRIEKLDNYDLDNNLYNSSSVVYSERVNTNEDKVLSLEGLEAGYYKVTYIAEQYNVGRYGSTSLSNTNVSISKNINNETKDYIIISTNSNIKGSINLSSLSAVLNNDNQFNINDKSRWRSTGSTGGGTSSITSQNNTVSLSAKNEKRYYAYYLPNCKNKKVTVTFKAKYETTATTVPKIWIGQGTTASSKIEIPFLTKEVGSVYQFTFALSSIPYISFEIDEVSEQNNLTTLQLYDVMIESDKTYKKLEETGNNQYIISPDIINSDYSNSYKYTAYNEKDSYLGSFDIDIISEEKIEGLEYYIKINEEGKSDSYTGLIDVTSDIQKYNYEYSFNKNTKYDVSIYVEKDSRFYKLDSVSFTTETEIRSINSITEFLNIHPNGKYMVSTDLDFSTKGGYISNFYGTIDFQGHNVTLTSSRGSYLVYNLGISGVLKNINLHFKLSDNKTSYWGFVGFNDGLLDNVIINFEKGNNKDNYNIALFGYQNKGVVSNFVINAKESLYGIYGISYGFYYNYGIIKNGYIYGKNIVSYPMAAEYTGNKYIAPLVCYAAGISNVYNVYSLIGIDTVDGYTYRDADFSTTSSLIAYTSYTNIKNIYTYPVDNSKKGKDIVAGYYGTVLSDNVYYASDKNDAAAYQYSSKISKLSLISSDFQNRILNSENAFLIDELVNSGFYPQIKLNSIMPNQEYIQLPVITDMDKIDVLNIETIDYCDVDSSGNNPCSSHNVDANKYEAIISLSLNNPAYETINEITISNIKNSQILSQRYDEKTGYTILEIGLESPSVFLSKYYVTSIYSTNSFGIKTQGDFSSNQKIIDLILYKKVSSLKDLRINKTQNYKLVKDIDVEEDLQNYSSNRIDEFKGILDGNGYTIKNMRFGSLFTKLQGTIQNLNVENYSFVENDEMLDEVNKYTSFIYTASYATLNNIHINNVNITTSYTTGGLIRQSNYTNIYDCSASNVTINVVNEGSDVYIGGLIGRFYYSSFLSNSFVSNLNVDTSTATNVSMLGGLVGYSYNSDIKYTYATGKVKSIADKTGGLVGYNQGTISYSYSNIDIVATKDKVGGIVGSSSNYYINNNLAIGNIYTSSNYSEIGRIVGDVNVGGNNYAYENMMVNGRKSFKNRGEMIATTSELSSEVFYKELMNFADNYQFSSEKLSNLILPKLYRKGTTELVHNQIDSKIIDTSSNLEFLGLETDEITNEQNIVVLAITPSDDSRQIVDIKQVEINGLKLDLCEYEDPITKEKKKSITYNPDNHNYRVKFKSSVNGKYYDNYLITSFTYILDDGQEVSVSGLSVRVDISYYQEIKTIDDWLNKVSSVDGQNYKLTADLDFSNVTDPTKIVKVYDKKINRLLGECKDENGSSKNCDISNVKIDLTQSYAPRNDQIGLISTLSSELSNINFNNIEIKNIETQSDDYQKFIGIIVYASGKISDVNFNNILLDAKNSILVAAISIETSASLRRVNVNGATVYGRYRTASLIAYSHGGEINEVDVENVHIHNQSIASNHYYTGGVIGYRYSMSATNSINQYDIHAKCVDVTSVTDYTGGIYGYGVASNISLDTCDNKDFKNSIGTNDNYVKGKSYVGGLMGYMTLSSNTTTGGEQGATSQKLYNFSSNNSVIRGASYTGGLFGYSSGGYYGIYNSNVDSADIEGSSYVGGFIGGHSGGIYNSSVNNTIIKSTGDHTGGFAGIQYSTIDGCGVTKSTISSKGSNVGGISGLLTASILRDFVIDSSISGSQNVGGLAGKTDNTNSASNIYYSYSNAIVDATGSNAGGILGYYLNKNYTTAYRYVNIYNNIVASSSVSGIDHTGGIIGGTDQNINDITNTSGKYAVRNNIVVSNNTTKCTSEEESCNTVGSIVGDMSKLSNNDSNYIYENNQNNGVKANDVENVTTDGVITTKLLLSVDDLNASDNSIYKKTGIDSYFDIPNRIIGNYPKLKNIPNQLEIKLPIQENPILFRSSMLMSSRRFATFRSYNATSYLLPDVQVYTSDINKINIEFSTITPNTYFYINNGDRIYSTERTYSIYYDFSEDIELTVGNNLNEQKYTYKPSELQRKVSTIGDKYYLLKDNTLISNDTNISGTYNNLYSDKLLKQDGSIYNILTKEIAERDYDNYSLAPLTSLYSFENDGNIIHTYYKYSTINNENIEKQVFVKNNELKFVDSNLDNDKTSVIIDSYNNEKYLMVLKNDGKLYNLEDIISYPDKFINEEVEQMSNNLNNNTDLALILYKNGNFVCFNYRTGIVANENTPTKESIGSYFKKSINKFVDNSLNNEKAADEIDNPNYSNYKEAQDLISKLEEKPIYNIIESDSVNVTNDYSYSIYYDDTAREYKVYETKAYISKTSPITVNNTNSKENSIDEIIKSSDKLRNYYYADKDVKQSTNWILIFTSIFLAIASSIYLLSIYLKSKNKQVA